MNTSTTDKKYLSPAEAADQLAISAGTVRRLIKENKIEAYRFGNQIRIVADTSGITETGVQSLSYNVYYPDNISRNSITDYSAVEALNIPNLTK